MEGLIYAYGAPKSAAQQKFTQERLAAIAEQRKRRTLRQDRGQALERTTSNSSSLTVAPGVRDTITITRDTSYGEMEYARVPPPTPSSNSSSQSEIAHHNLLNNPFELRHGRRYLRELPYPLPVDLHEIQRQDLQTLLCSRVFGKLVCSPNLKKKALERVLEIGCGSGYWSAMCHEYFASLGAKDVSFTGLDVAPLAPDLKKQGVNWSFVQHDLRRFPIPFEDEHFDLVMMKDMSLVMPEGMASQKLIDECIRVLREGGTLEIWESDHVLRSLLPHPPAPMKQQVEQEAATKTATFLVAAGTPFAPAQNKYLQQANAWIHEALNRRKLPPMPCSRIGPILYQEPESLANFGSRRVAIPLGELRWEGAKHSRHPSDVPKGKPKVSEKGQKALTLDQAAIRQTALISVLQFIENLEPLLKEASGKNTDEWSNWWASMMADLLDPSQASLGGECLEIGAWWATKRTEDV